MQIPRSLFIAVVALVGMTGSAVAQNSAYGVLGIGFPSQQVNVVSRSLGGGNGAVDPQSFLNPAALTQAVALSVEAATMMEFRRFTTGSNASGSLEQDRFPYVNVTTPLARRFAYAIGFSQYAERTYDVATTDTVLLRGTPITVTDRSGSSGAIVDIRGALAWSASPKFSAGLGLHVLGGSAKVSTSRAFSDSIFRPFSEVVDASFKAYGVSAGFLAIPTPALQWGTSMRFDTKLTRTVNAQKVGEVKLPTSLSTGVLFRASPLVRFSSSLTWRSWSGAAADLASVGTRAFSTINAGLGIDMGGARGGPPLPLRLGARYATLPFSPTASQPHEIGISAGSGFGVSGGRARFDGAVERVMRSGAGVSEHAWQVTLGFQIRP